MHKRVQLQPAYLLHSRPWSETSLLIDVFTREHGRFRLLAKGARRLKTGHRGELQPFQPLSISWSGKQLATLTTVEITQVRPAIRRTALACAYYMNELLFKLLHLHDPHEALFDAYDVAMQRLASEAHAESILRVFECELLQEVGFGLMLEHEARTGRAVESGETYYYYPEQGPIRAETPIDHPAIEPDAARALLVSGETLLQLAARELTSERARTQSKRLIRVLMSRFLRGQPVRSRRVFESMLAYQQPRS